ncbi:MAG: CarD family transcriptional regulator, partial [Actinomycetota bacterium]
AERFATQLRSWAPDTALFPAWETLPHEKLSPRAETVARRLQTLHQIRSDTPPRVVVAPVRAVIQHMVPGSERIEPVVVRKGDQVSLDELADRLAVFGYRRTDMVTSRGEFAVRGFLLDVFPPTEDHPIRVELFGDEVDSLREFAVASQRSLGPAEGLAAFPCRELLLTDEVRGRAIAALDRYPQFASELHRLADGLAFEGMESHLEVLFERPPVLRELLPLDARVLVVEPKRTADRAAEMAREVEELREAGWASAAEGAVAPAEGTYATVERALGARPAALTPFRGDALEVEAHVWDRGRTDVPAIAAELKRRLAAGFRVLVAAESQGSADRIREILAGHELFLPQHDGGPLAPSRGAVAVAPIDEGFSSEQLGLAVVGESDLFGKRRPHREPRAQRRRVTQIEVEPGDLAVHVVHGVGRYLGMETREIGPSRADYLVLEYAEGDRLYVPADQLDLVSRYIGGELPKLHRLGGAEWNRQKSKVRKAVKDIAGELVKLYAARSQQPGFGFSMDQPWQRELEDAFPYMETRDQLAAIDDVKAD